MVSTGTQKMIVPTAPIRSAHKAASSAMSKDEMDRLGLLQSDVDQARPFKVKKSFLTRRLKASQRMLLLDNLSTMLAAGLSITDALVILSGEMHDKQLKRALQTIRYGVETGRPFSEGLALFPYMFPKVIIATVRVGEASGTLVEVLAHLADIARRENKLKKKVIGALMYPIVVFTAMIGVAVVMLTYVFPQIISVFDEANIKLPIQIRFMNWVGSILQSYGLYILLGVILAGICFALLLRVRFFKKIMDRIALKFPFFGKSILIGSVLARFTSNLRIMLISGLPIVDALNIVAETNKNLIYKDELFKISHEIETGISIHESLAVRPHIFPSLVIRMMKVGEETGRLDDVLKKMTVYYEEKVDDTLSNLSTILEPALLLIVGVAVGFLAVSIIGPIYEIANNIK